MRRNLADHIVALSRAIDTVKDVTDSDVHLVGYSQGGMFCYQAAAYRRSKNIASIVAFGSPVDTLAALPMGIPANFAAPAANFMADHVFSRLDIPGWLARAGFQMLDPLKTAKARVDFVRQLHDREALLPREQQRRFLEREGWIAWSGPAISELLKQFIAHNRMMTGGFAINGQMVTLTDITCPVLAFVGEVDDIGQPASVRGIRRAAPNAEVYECLIRTGHFGLVVGSKAAKESWPTVAAWVQWLSTGGDKPHGHRPDGRSARRAHRQRRRVELAAHPRHRGSLRGGAGAGSRRGQHGRDGQQIHAHTSRRDLPDVAATGPAGTAQRPHPDFAGPHHRGTGTRRPAGRVPLVRRARAHLRGREPAHQQCRSWSDRSRGTAGRPRRRADGDAAQRAGRHRRVVSAGCGRRGDAAETPTWPRRSGSGE